MIIDQLYNTDILVCKQNLLLVFQGQSLAFCFKKFRDTYRRNANDHKQKIMSKSSILSKAGQQTLSNELIQPAVMQKSQHQNQHPLQFHKSSISDNLLQEMDEDYEEIEGYESKYVDEEGNQVSQSQSLSPSKSEAQNEFLPKKDKSGKNRFTNQPIMEEPHHAQDQEIQSPIKDLNKPSSKPSSKQSNFSNSIFSPNTQSPQRPGTLLKNYSKTLNKYQQQLDMYSEQKRNLKAKQNQKPTYLTNSRGLKEEDFYKVDYNNTGKYSSNVNSMSDSFVMKQSLAFFNTKVNDLEDIEDILSDIKGLNQSSSNSNYTSAKVFNKGSLDLGGSRGKYKGNKNFASFASSNGKFNSSFKGMSNSVTNKLDDLLTSYRLGQSFTSSSLNNTSTLRKDLSSSTYNEGNLPNESSLSQSSRFDEINKRQLRKIQREQNRKNNKYYEQVKNEIKYGLAESEEKQIQESKQIKNGSLNHKNDNDMKKSIQIDLNKKTATSQKKTSNKSPDPQTLELVKKLRLYHINWNQIPLLPGQSHESFYQLKSYPNFTSDQTELLTSTFNKLQKINLHTYSIFSNAFTKTNTQNLIGLKELSLKPKDKNSPKSYKLMNKKEFIEKWNEVYEQSKEKFKDKQLILSEEEIEILIEFDLKWYTALVKYVYEKDLSTLVETYKNKKEDEYESVVSTKKYVETLTKINQFKPKQNLSVSESITLNKLKLLKQIFSSLSSSLLNEYSFGIISSILREGRTQKQEKLIKEFLKQNFRGGIYFTDKQNLKNICILELNKNKSYQIDQVSNDSKKEVWINKKVVLSLWNDPKDNEAKYFFEINIMIDAQTSYQENYEEQETLKLNCCYNQIQYEVQQQVIKEQILHFCKKYQILVNS